MSDERLLQTFLSLVRVASPSFAEGEVAKVITSELQQAGLTVRVDGSASNTGSDTGNLVATLPATGPGRTVVLSAHMDTVGPCDDVDPVIEDGVIRSAGETVLGADDKAGVAAIIEALRRLGGSGEPHPEVRVLFTVAEEVGLVGAKGLDPEDVHGDLCLVLDADGAPGGIVVGSPTHYTFQAVFTGMAAHAGVQPEKGRSALLMAAKAVASMPFGRIDDETTANIGTIESKGATNVVAARAAIGGECRSRDPKKVEAVRSEMHEAMKAAASEVGGSVDVEWTKEYDAVHFDDDDPLIEMIEEACRDAGLEPSRFVTGGGSDASVLHAMGVPTIALSSGMSDVHSVDESLRVEDLTALVELVLAVVAKAAD